MRALPCPLPHALVAAAMAATLLSACSGGDKAGAGKTPAYLVYATNEGSGDISIIDPTTMTEISKIAIGKRPRGLVASPDGRTLYVAVSGSANAGPGVDESKLPPPDKAADGIVVIDLTSRKVLRTLRGISDPEQMAISPDGTRLYVASEDTGELVMISPDGRMLGKLEVGGQPEGIGVSADGKTILATSEENHTVAILRGTPPAVTARVDVGARPRNAVFLDQTRAVVPGEFDASLSVVDLTTAKRTRTITLDKSDRPMGVAPIDAKTILLTTGRGGRLVRIDVDAKGDGVTGSVAVGKRPWGLAMSPDNSRAFTANGPSNDITAVDPKTMKVVGRVTVGTGPWGVRAVATPGQ